MYIQVYKCIYGLPALYSEQKQNNLLEMGLRTHKTRSIQIWSQWVLLIQLNNAYIYSFPHTDITWWRHQMETFSALLALWAGNSPVTREFPPQRPVTRSIDVFFDLCLNQRLSKQSRRRWFEALSRPLWRPCNGDSLVSASQFVCCGLMTCYLSVWLFVLCCSDISCSRENFYPDMPIWIILSSVRLAC